MRASIRQETNTRQGLQDTREANTTSRRTSYLKQTIILTLKFRTYTRQELHQRRPTQYITH